MNVSVTRPSSVTNNNTLNKTYILGTTMTKLTLNIQRLHTKLNRTKGTQRIEIQNTQHTNKTKDTIE